MKKSEKTTLLILIVVAVIAGIIYVGPYKLICSKYSWSECANWETQYDTCYDTCTRQTTDCTKCGEDIYLQQSYKDGWKAITTQIIASTLDIRVHWIVYSDSSYSTIGCHGWTDWGGTDVTTCEGYLMRVLWRKECKTCTETYQCNPHNCNPRQVCTDWQARQGTQCPPDAENCQCIEQQESCGNNICEPQYDETIQSCPADCSQGICTPGQTKCDGNIVRQCNMDGTDWMFKENCQSGCVNGQCVQDTCIEGEEKTTTCTDGSVVVTHRCIYGQWQNTGFTCPGGPPDCLDNRDCTEGKICENGRCVYPVNWMIVAVLIGIGVAFIIGGIYFLRRGKK